MSGAAAWLKNSGYGPVSPVGAAAAEVVGTAYKGIYHLSDADLGSSDWANKRYCRVRVSGSLATFDGACGMPLTHLVVLATDASLRLEISPRSRTTLDLWLHQRARRSGGSKWERLPELDDLVALARAAQLVPSS